MAEASNARDRAGAPSTVPSLSVPRAAVASPADPGELAQHEIVRLRSRLLGGRGPGATPQETARFMSARPAVGAVATVVERERVEVRTNIARGDADAIEADLIRTRADAADALRAGTARLAPLWIAVRGAVFGAAATRALGLLATRMSRRRNRVAGTRPGRTDSPNQSSRRPPVR